MISPERLSGADALAAQDDWTTTPTEPTPEPYDQATAAAAALRVADGLDQLDDVTASLDRDLLGAIALATDLADPSPLVSVAVRVQDVRRKLGQLEAILAHGAGQIVRADPEASREGVLSDGRRFELTKGKDRKAWDHPSWQADVRRQVLSGIGPVVDTATGEEVDVHGLLAAAEQAHGSTGPRVGQLKALGLRPDDYCESVPGPWAVRVYGTAGEDDV